MREWLQNAVCKPILRCCVANKRELTVRRRCECQGGARLIFMSAITNSCYAGHIQSGHFFQAKARRTWRAVHRFGRRQRGRLVATFLRIETSPSMRLCSFKCGVRQVLLTLFVRNCKFLWWYGFPASEHGKSRAWMASGGRVPHPCSWKHPFLLATCIAPEPYIL